MTEISLIYQVLVFLITFLGGWLAFWVYFFNPKEKMNQWFFLMTIFLLLWAIFAYFGASSQVSISIILYRLNWGVIPLAALATYFFVVYFPKEEKRYPFLEKIIIIVTLFFCFISFFTDLIIKDVNSKEWGNEVVFGKLGDTFSIVSAILLIILLGQLLKKYFKLSRADKIKVEYFLIGGFLCFLFNLIFNIIFPIIFKTIQYQHLGDFSAIFILVFTAYAIVKQELFGIKVIITSIFIGLIAILLSVDTLVFTDNLILQLFKGLAVFIFLYLGLALIKSVKREIEQRKEIEKLSSAKSEFIAIASHQLRTPLTAVKGYISMILEGSYGKIPEKAKTPMEKVYQQNEKLVKLVNDLLSLSRIESGKLQLELGMASMEDLISSIVGIFDVQAKDKNLYLKFEKPKEIIPLIMMDVDKTRQVISNIINNCLKYTEKGGVDIKLKIVNGKLQIEISDTGLGMEEKELGKLFQSFSRGEAGARMDAGGAGLGLHIAKKFIEMQKGNIWAKSAGKGKGSQFYIELPINNHNNHK
ncbi:MAG: ATP-binding protein [Candidatus Nealsonbacteria bacterium]|nr:ATP-binding protein [Candidatus Nealsonbacteria bacterium]